MKRHSESASEKFLAVFGRLSVVSLFAVLRLAQVLHVIRRGAPVPRHLHPALLALAPEEHSAVHGLQAAPRRRRDGSDLPHAAEELRKEEAAGEAPLGRRRAPPEGAVLEHRPLRPRHVRYLCLSFFFSFFDSFALFRIFLCDLFVEENIKCFLGSYYEHRYQFNKPETLRDFELACGIQDRRYSFTILLGGTSGYLYLSPF